VSAMLAPSAEGWPRVPLAHVADLVRGVSYPKTDAREEPAAGHVPVLRATNIQDARLVLDSDLVFIAERNVSPEQLLRPGDIVLATSSGSKHLVGKSGQLRAPWHGSFGAFCAAVRPKKGINPHYLALFLQAPAYWRQITKKALGVNINNLRRGDLESLELPLPPLAVQERIVAGIEKQFSRLDEAVAILKRVKANLKRYKATVLKAAVEGHLVETEAELARREGRGYETGTQLLQRILDPSREPARVRARYKESPSADLPLGTALPEGWAIVRLEHLTNKITSGSRDWSRYYNRGADTFVLAQNVRPLAPDFSVRQTVDPPRCDPSRERSRVATGDLLITIVGANTGQVCLVENLPGEAYVSQSVALIRPVTPGIAAYLNYWLNSEEHGQRYFERCMYGQGRPHLSFDQLHATPIALPPLAEEKRIMSEVERRLSFVRALDVELRENEARTERLRQAILNAGFFAAPRGGTVDGLTPRSFNLRE
jgi:type I restriction enzyme, S subunit